jgi:peptidoglycan/xylan/chitin deacetylase (PgdA/CDA1 family)
VRGPAAAGAVALTFDDGPHPEHTPRLLDVLAGLGIPATFFLIGREAERHPALVQRIAAEGHAVGGHSYTHGDPALTPARQLLDEVRRTRDLLGTILGCPPDLFRPPHGKLSAAKLLRLWVCSQSVVLWNVDPKDFVGPTADAVWDRLRATPPRGGDVVLLHDNHPHAARLVPDLAPVVRDRGLTFTTVIPWVS